MLDPIVYTSYMMRCTMTHHKGPLFLSLRDPEDFLSVAYSPVLPGLLLLAERGGGGLITRATGF